MAQTDDLAAKQRELVEQAIERSRNPVVNDPCGMLVPLFVVDVTRPPENWPRATSYVVVITRVERSASCGTVP